MTLPTAALCATCMYWEPIPALAGLNEELGACKRMPPLPAIRETAPAGEVVKLLGRWPLTPADAWCGEYYRESDEGKAAWSAHRGLLRGAVRKPPAEGAG